MNVTVMSRTDACRYCHQEHDTPAIMISISTPYYTYSARPVANAKNGLKGVLRLEFEDAETGRDIMAQSDAEKIRIFIERHPDTDIIVHCDAGISRSAAVAAAILKARTGDDSRIFDSPRHQPNMHVYRLTLNALMAAE